MTVVWQHRDKELAEPAAVLAFAGWGDAGRSATGAVRHLHESYPSEMLAEIAPDEFFDFTVRRPITYLDEGKRKIRWPEIQIHAVHHPERDLVVVVGEEPHLRWRFFTDTVADLLGELGVRQVVLLGAFLGEVPHTRPTPIFGAGNLALIEAHALHATNYQGPTGIVGVLTASLDKPSRPAAALWGAVPHYLENPDYPGGAYALLSKLSEILGLAINTSDLAARSLEFRIALDREFEGETELAAHLRKLEAAYPIDEHGQGSLVDEIERFLQERG